MELAKWDGDLPALNACWEAEGVMFRAHIVPRGGKVDVVNETPASCRRDYGCNRDWIG